MFPAMIPSRRFELQASGSGVRLEYDGLGFWAVCFPGATREYFILGVHSHHDGYIATVRVNGNSEMFLRCVSVRKSTIPPSFAMKA